jgi:hypothetical protein
MVAMVASTSRVSNSWRQCSAQSASRSWSATCSSSRFGCPGRRDGWAARSADRSPPRDPAAPRPPARSAAVILCLAPPCFQRSRRSAEALLAGAIPAPGRAGPAHGDRPPPRRMGGPRGAPPAAANGLPPRARRSGPRCCTGHRCPAPRLGSTGSTPSRPGRRDTAPHAPGRRGRPDDTCRARRLRHGARAADGRQRDGSRGKPSTVPSPPKPTGLAVRHRRPGRRPGNHRRAAAHGPSSPLPGPPPRGDAGPDRRAGR